MKFLVLKRIETKADSAAARKQAQVLQQLVKNGPLEHAWLLRDGGFAYLTPADAAGHPVTPSLDASVEAAGHVEIFPVTNALEFLDQAATPQAKTEARG